MKIQRRENRFNLKHLLRVGKETKTDVSGTSLEVHSNGATATSNSGSSGSMATAVGVRSLVSSNSPTATTTTSATTTTTTSCGSSGGGSGGGSGPTPQSTNDRKKGRLMANEGGGISFPSKDRESQEKMTKKQDEKSKLLMKAIEKKRSPSISANVNSFPCEEIEAAKEEEMDMEEEKKSGNRVIYTDELELRAHDGAVYVARFSPCGSYVATGSLDKEIFFMGYAKSAK